MAHAMKQAVRLDVHIRAAWQEQLAAARKTQGVLPALVRHREDLLPRFAATYAHLRALPRRVRRMLQRRWKQSLAGLALWLALGQSPALAATINVNATCMLVDAITAANTDSATGGCPAGSGADTIVLPANSTQTLTGVNNSTYGPTGLPVISSEITIEGQGSTIVRKSTAPEFRILVVGSTGELTLNETLVSGGIAPVAPNPYAPPYYYNGGGVANYGGTLTVTNSTIACNTTVRSSGGGVHNGGTLTVTDSTISGNTADRGGGVHNDGTLTVTDSTISGNTGIYGGGVLSGGTLTVMNSTISGNEARICGPVGCLGYGGGVRNDGTLIVKNSTISGNYGADGGGGVFNVGTFSVTDSTISGNRVVNYHGGGVANYGGALTVTNSTISGNTGGDYGGGVFSGGTLTVMNSTISGNHAFEGGGVWNGGSLTVTNSTISGNTATYGSGGGVWNSARSTLTLARTLVSGNTAPGGPEIYNRHDVYYYVGPYGYYGPYSGTVVANDFNLLGLNGTVGVGGFTPGATDIVPGPGIQLTDILDPTLADNGGPTLTHNLVPGSRAIDVIPASNPGCTGTDQRGVPRPQGNSCDIGAVEFTTEAVPLPVTIDIRPGLAHNRLPLADPATTKPVAILSTETFGALTVDPTTVRFGATGTEAAPRHVARNDVNGDGRPDLIVRFRLGDTGIECGDTEALLTGETVEGQPIEGGDAIKTVQCP